jgi:uncharacterized protein YaeQ
LALKATIHKAELQLSDLDRNHYQTYQLTLAKHPSETDERMLVRLLAFALNADESLSFTKGLSTDDEPDLWNRSLTDEIVLWIEVGHPSIKRIRQAAGKSQQVFIYNYAGRSSDIWWQQIQDECKQIRNLSVFKLSPEAEADITALSQRNMNLSCTIQDGQIYISDADRSLSIEVQTLLSPQG